MNAKNKIGILFICMGNICRSPTAEAVFRRQIVQAGLSDRVWIDSAGTHDYHIGQPPDSRSQFAAKTRGYEMSDLRARQVQREDFQKFDYILAMDENNLSILHRLCDPGLKSKAKLFLEYRKNSPEREVPDPYYGGKDGFEKVLNLVEEAGDGLLEEIRMRLSSHPR